MNAQTQSVSLPQQHQGPYPDPAEELCGRAVRAALCELVPQTRRAEAIGDSETLFVDLGLNSLEYLELWTLIEARLGCRFDDEDLLGDLRTVGDVIHRVQEVCHAESPV